MNTDKCRICGILFVPNVGENVCMACVPKTMGPYHIQCDGGHKERSHRGGFCTKCDKAAYYQFDDGKRAPIYKAPPEPEPHNQCAQCGADCPETDYLCTGCRGEDVAAA